MPSEADLFGPGDRRPIVISAANARLEFNGCQPGFIANVCHGRCCWVSNPAPGPVKKLTTIYVEPHQREEIAARGGEFDERGVLKTTACGTCKFQLGSGEHKGMCQLHPQTAADGGPVKPRSCYISPWVLSKNDKLIIRNRYKMLSCYRAEPRLPAYLAFASGLRMLFGAEFEAIKRHFREGGGDYAATLPADLYNLVKHVRDTWNDGYHALEEQRP